MFLQKVRHTLLDRVLNKHLVFVRFYSSQINTATIILPQVINLDSFRWLPLNARYIEYYPELWLHLSFLGLYYFHVFLAGNPRKRLLLLSICQCKHKIWYCQNLKHDSNEDESRVITVALLFTNNFYKSKNCYNYPIL